MTVLVVMLTLWRGRANFGFCHKATLRVALIDRMRPAYPTLENADRVRTLIGARDRLIRLRKDPEGLRSRCQAATRMMKNADAPKVNISAAPRKPSANNTNAGSTITYR